MVGTSDFAFGFDTKITGVDETILQLQTMMPEVRKALEVTIGNAVKGVQDQARALASGDVLQSRSGRYVNSIKSDMVSNDSGVFGHVFSDDPRADLFEYGGSTPARDILPNVAQVLRFAGSPMLASLSLGTVGMVFAAVVHRPVVQYQKRSVIDAAFDAARTDVEVKIGDAVLVGIEQRTAVQDIESASHSIEFKGH